MEVGVIEIIGEAADAFKEVEGFKGEGWYFWDETETQLIGPFKSDERAQIALSVYAASM